MQPQYSDLLFLLLCSDPKHELCSQSCFDFRFHLKSIQDVQGSPTGVEEVHGQEDQPENQWESSGQLFSSCWNVSFMNFLSPGRGDPLWLRPLHESGPGRRYRVQ